MLGIFLDTETNGLDATKHRVLEISIKIVKLTTGAVCDTLTALVFQPDEVWSQSDPRSLEVNGFTKEMTDQGRREDDVAEDVKKLFDKHGIVRGGAVFICQNPSFDRIFFSQLIAPDEQEARKWPYHWLDLASMYWGKLLSSGEALPWERGFTKDKIAQAFNIPSEEAPHRAERGVDHLIACYQAVVGFPGEQETNNGPKSRN